MAEGYTGTPLVLAVPAVGGLALAVRLVAIPLLVRAQQAVRERALAARGGPPAPPIGLAAAFGDLLAGLATGAGLLWLLAYSDNFGFYRLLATILPSDGFSLGSLLGLHAAHFYIDVAEYLVPAVAALVAWLLLWVLTQRKLLTAGMPEGFRPSPGAWVRVAAGGLLRLALGLLALPIGLVIGALLFQVVAVVTAGRPRTALTPPPVPPQPYAPPIGQPWPYAAQAPHAQPAPSPQPHPAPQGAP
ncbi:hypothetical protein ACWGB8_37065, partial [Kitasatospora sp. NPDC054939]